MKGFYTDYGYCGQIDNENYQLFATLDEYLEYLSDLDKEKDADESADANQKER